MGDIRVTVAYHFIIDPAKQAIGMIDYPSTVTKTVSVGESIQPAKVSFSDVFTDEDDKRFITEKLTEAVEETLRTAKPVSSSSKPKTAGDVKEEHAPGCEDAGEEGCSSCSAHEGDGDMNLFD